MTFAFLLLVILLARVIDILWLPAFFCAVAAMHWTVPLHLPDPLAPLYAFCIGGVIARLALEPVRQKLDRWMK